MKGSLSQVSFFPEVAHARHGDPATAHKAAASVRGLTETQEKVRACLISGPKTDEEIVARFRELYPNDSTTDQSIRSRRAELVNPRFPRQPMVRWNGDHGLTSHKGKSRKWELIP
jgi:hypothetical protein